MKEPIAFLNSFAQSMATMTLYSPGHPARSKAIETSFSQLQTLLAENPHPLFSFLDQSVIYGELPLHSMERWPWSSRLSAIGIQRLEFDVSVSLEDYGAFLDHVLVALTKDETDSPQARRKRDTVKFGQVGMREGMEVVPVEHLATLRLPYTLSEEVQVVGWLQELAGQQGKLSTAEVEIVVRSLAIAMHCEGHLMAPILGLKEYDQYASIHSINVAVLTMTFAESAGLADADVHTFGIAGLLHDIGMTQLDPSLLNKESLTLEERTTVEQHPLEGARLLLASEEQFELAAVVAYEHHIRPDGNGYPRLHYPRECHYASKIVGICSAYNALRMTRPFRPAWHLQKALEYVYENAGKVFDREIAWDFVAMMQRLEGRMGDMAIAT